MKNVFIIINIILLTFVAFFSAKIMYKGIEISLTGDSLQLKEKILPVKSNNDKKYLKKRNYNKIIKKNIFNVTTDKKAKALNDKKNEIKEIEKLKTTSLKLKLLGTIAAENQSEAYAVILDQKKSDQSLYKVGQRIQGAKILKILRQKIVLRFNGEDQVLEMDFLADLNKKSGKKKK
jgi:type II secretion system protein C